MNNSVLMCLFVVLIVTAGVLISGISKRSSEPSRPKEAVWQIDEALQAKNLEIENSIRETKTTKKTSSDPKEVLDKLLVREFSRPNKWKYKILWVFGPYLNRGLTYSFDFIADISNCKIESTEKVEQIQAEIYAENIVIANSIREIRPFLGSFPLTPESFQVSVGFLDENMQFVDPPYIISVNMRPSQLEFNHFLKEETTHRFKEILVKPILECPGLAPFLHPCVKRSAVAKKPVIPEAFAKPG